MQVTKLAMFENMFGIVAVVCVVMDMAVCEIILCVNRLAAALIVANKFK